MKKSIAKIKKFPKFIYEKEDDVLNIFLSKKKLTHAEQEGDIIVHFTEENEPVYIEILDASSFLKEQGESLPKKIKQRFFQTSLVQNLH